MEAAATTMTHSSPFRTWAAHLLCFVLPVTTLAFVSTGPHPWWLAPAFLLPLLASVIIDMNSRAETRQPDPNLPVWPFDAILYVLVALQVVNIVLLARMISQAGLFSMDAAVAMLLVGVNSGYSAIVVGHELIHRASPFLQLLGRVLMVTTMYEHFCTEHVRGHHARVGTDADPATARFGETFHQFFHRTVPAQLASAWQIENKRLANHSGVAFWLRHRVLQGLAAEWALAAAILALFGPAAFLVHLGQAFHGIAALEAVNYFEHWGLRRSSRKVRPMDSWDTDSRFTLYTLVGLSRHADHHAYAARPYQQLRHWEESAKLPYGYFGMVLLVWTRNDLVRRLLTAELRRRKMGPFAETASQAEPHAAAADPALHVSPELRDALGAHAAVA
ncbi:MAG TPA: fatty acid desaturase [Candidatus Limnocylindrales bacterium]|nr:fatty acid desaturase [Candidatus Limnocylindrales bacterium]